MPQIGQPAPTFTLPRTKTEKVSLGDLKGKKVVIAFYPAAFTGVCTEEVCTFRDSLAQFEQLDATVLAISADGVFTTGKFAEMNALNFPVLADVNRDAIQAYGVEIDNFAGIPGYKVSQRAVFVVDAAGNLAWQWIAPNPGVMPDFEAIKRALSEA